MDDLDLTEQVPRDFETSPIDLVDAAWTPVLVEPVTPLAPDRAALGTQTGIAALPRRTITLPPPIPQAALRAKGTESGVDVDFADEPATPLPAPIVAKPDDPAWLAKFNPPKLEDAAFLYDKPAPRETSVHVDGSVPSSTSAAADFWTASPRATEMKTATTADEPPPWANDHATSEPLSWTAPVIKQPAELPVAASPIAAIVAAAEAETAAAIAATMKGYAPKAAGTPAPVLVKPTEPPILAAVVAPETLAPPPAEPVRAAGSVDIGFDNEDGTTADPWAATDAASSAGLHLGPQPRRASSVPLPPPTARARTASSAAIVLPVDRTPSVLVDAEPAAMPKLPAPSANWAARRSGQIASATPPREPTQTLPPLPAPVQGWGRAPSPSAAALAPTALGRPHSSADITASLDDDDDVLLAAARPSRTTLKISALICAGGVVTAGLVYALVRAASPSAPTPTAPEAIAAPAPEAIAAPPPVAVAAPVAAPVAAAVPVAVAAPVAVAVPAPAPVAAPAPAAITVAVPAATPEIAPAATGPAPLPSVIAMPIITNPPGATVTLVANGAATVLGATPVTASLDPSKGYDLVIAYRGQPTRMQHVAPGTREVRIDLDTGASTHAIASAPETQETHHTAKVAPTPVATKPAPAVKATTPAPTPAPTHTAAKPAVAVAPGPNSGVLMVSSKPPCEIWVDGKSTHLMTPQKKMTLAAGPHTITLLNASQHITSSSKVEILVGLPSRLIKDFTTH